MTSIRHPQMARHLLDERFSKFLNRVQSVQYMQLQFTSGMTATCAT